MTTLRAATNSPRGDSLHLAALLGGNLALAFGPWFVRLADSGPVSAGFWRLVLPLPLLAILAVRTRQPLAGFGWPVAGALALAGVLFALDLAAWHVGIERTRLGNASLFGNASSLMLMVWSVIMARRLPRLPETLAIAAALAGSAILMGRSLEIDTRTLAGDLFCVAAGVFYFFYIQLLRGAHARLGSWAMLFHCSVAGAPVLLLAGWALGEPVWPQAWGPLVGLALCSQVIGQGLLVFALGRFSALMLGLSMLSQPAVSALAGWAAFGETLGWADIAGMVLVGASLVLARVGEPK